MILFPLRSSHVMGISLAKGRTVDSVGFGRGEHLVGYRIQREILVVEWPVHRDFTCWLAAGAEMRWDSE